MTPFDVAEKRRMIERSICYFNTRGERRGTKGDANAQIYSKENSDL